MLVWVYSVKIKYLNIVNVPVVCIKRILKTMYLLNGSIDLVLFIKTSHSFRTKDINGCFPMLELMSIAGESTMYDISCRIHLA